MEALISVIIPVYNRSDLLKECVQSVQNQSWSNYEIILIDDGSTDETPMVCRELMALDSRIRLFSGDHGGVSAARNIGLDNATGDYVFFLDSDDVIHPGLFEVLVNAMVKTGAPMGGTRIQNVQQSRWDGAILQLLTDTTPPKTDYMTHNKIMEIVFRQETPLGRVGGVMIRRDWIGQTRFACQLHIGEDMYFVYENLIKGADAIFLDRRWYFARLHESNSSWDYGFQGFWSRFRRRELIWESEERLGRQKNVLLQKNNGFHCFVSCINRCGWNTEDGRRMRKVMKSYGKTLWPALNAAEKSSFLLIVYVPVLYACIRGGIKWIKGKAVGKNR